MLQFNVQYAIKRFTQEDSGVTEKEERKEEKKEEAKGTFDFSYLALIGIPLIIGVIWYFSI